MSQPEDGATGEVIGDTVTGAVVAYLTLGEAKAVDSTSGAASVVTGASGAVVALNEAKGQVGD